MLRCIFLVIFVIQTILTVPNAITLLNNPSGISYSPDGNLFAITDSAVNQLVFLDGKISQINGQILVYPTKRCGIMRKCKPRGIFGLLQPIETKFTPNNTCLFVAMYGQVAGLPGAVYAYHINDCSLDFSTVIPGVFAPTSLDISYDGKLLAIGDAARENGKILLYNLNSCGVVNAENPSIRTCFGVESIRVLFSPDGSALAVSDISKNRVYLYAIENGLFVSSKPTVLDCCRPHALAFSPDGNTLAIGEYRSKSSLILAQIVDRAFTGITQKISKLNFISTLAFSPDGNFLAAGEFFKDRVHLFSIFDGRVIGKAKKIRFTCNSGISALAFSPKSSCLAIAQENSNKVNFIENYALGFGG